MYTLSSHYLPCIFPYYTEATCADKETQTEQADFNKLTNGQTIQMLNDNKAKEQQKLANDDKVQCNNIKVNNNTNDKQTTTNNSNNQINTVCVTNEKADTL